MRRGATCPACRGPGALVGYNRAPVEAVHLCLHCGGRFTVPLARAEEMTAKGAVQ